MADGGTREISTIKEGEKVLAHDPDTGATSEQVVEDLHINQDTELTDLTVRTEDGKFATLKTTQNHPFWSESQGKWVNAADLKPTEWLKTASGERVNVAKVHNFIGNKTMRDLTVANIHTYYVIAGDEPVLVHNCGNGGKYGQLQPAGAGNEINHMPQNAATPITKYSGPAIRMDRADHRQIYSTGSSPASRAWLQMQRELVDSGQIDRALMNDINDVTSRFPGRYNNAIAEMIGSLPQNAAYQELRTVPSQVHVQMTLW